MAGKMRDGRWEMGDGRYQEEEVDMSTGGVTSTKKTYIAIPNKMDKAR